MAQDKIKSLYNAFVEEGYDMESEDEFRKNLADPAKRKAAYDALKNDGYDMEAYDDFEANIGFGKAQAVPDSANIVGVTPPYAIGTASQAPYAIGVPMPPAANQPSQHPALEAKKPDMAAEESSTSGNGYQPSEAEIARFRNKVDNAVAEVGEESQTTKNLKEYYGRIKPGERSSVVKGAAVYDPESGEMVDRYLTDSGVAFEDKDAAGAMRSIDVSQRTVESEVSRIYNAWAKEHPNATDQEKEAAQKEAYARQQWYERMRYIDTEIERLERLAQEQDKIAYPETGGEAKGLFYRTKDEIAQRENPERREAAAKAGGFRRAIDKLREAKERYERGEQNVDSHWLMDYTRGFGSGLKEMVTNPFGLTSMLEAGEMAYLKDKIEKGAELSDSEDAYLDAVIFGQETEQFSKERGMAYNVGESVALLAEMAAEFGLNPASGVTRAAVANSVKAFGKAAAKKTLTRPGTLAKLRAVGATGTAKAFAPAVGAALGEGVTIAGTTQLPKNYAEMQTRMNGHAERKVSGGYAFKESVGAGEAFAKSFGRAAGSNAIFLPSLGIKGFGGTMEKAAGKLFGESGAKVTGEIASVFKFPGKVLPMSNLPEAALKMKTSELLSVMSGDESIADWADPERNLETLAVLLAAEFMMGTPRKVAQGKAYYNVAKAKARAAQSYADAMSIFAESGKAEIFNDFHSRLRTVESPEEAIAALYHGREHLSEPEVKALYDMVGAMFRYKGASDYYNARYNAGRKGKDATPNDTEGAPSDSAEPIGENRRLRGSKGNPVDDMQATVDEVRTDSFAEGYAAEDNVSRRDIQSIYEARREALSSQIGSERVEMIDSLGDEFDISTVDEQQRHSVIDYISARSAWEGVDERLNEEGEERISEAEALIDSRTNQSDGIIQEVKLRNDDGFWWLRNGTINLLDNGEIDRSVSSEMVFLVNANGEVKSFALSDIAELGERVSPDVLKAQAREMEQSRKTAAESAIGGKLTFEPGEQGVAVIDGKTREFTVDGSAIDANGAPRTDAVSVTLDDGNKVEIATDVLQQGVDAHVNDVKTQERDRMDAANPASDSNMTGTPEASQEASQLSAMDRVPKDAEGKPVFTEADPETAWDAITGAFPSEASAQEWVGKQLAKAKGALSQLEKGRYDVPDDFAEAARAAQERASQIAAAKEYASRWEAISSVQKDRMAKAAEEAAAVRRAKEAEAEARRQTEREAASLAKQEAEAAKEAEKEWKRQKNALDKRLRDTAEEYKDVPGIMDILENTDPQTLDEMAAWLLANNRITLSDKKTSLGVRISAGARTFTGIGNYEAKKLFGQFASAEKGGVSIENLAEDIGKQFCDQFGIPYDNLALRDAIAERLYSSNTRGDIFNYIVERRIQQARELGEYYRQQEDLAYAEWCEENYHMSPEDYESYEEVRRLEAIAQQSIGFEALDGEIAEERFREQARIADYESVRMGEVKEALENLDEPKLNSNIADESTQQKHGLVRTRGKDPTGADGNSSGGSEILSSPRTVSPEGDPSMEERRSGIYARYGDKGTNKEGSLPESTSGNDREGVEEPGDGYLRTLFGDEGGGVQRGLFDDINKKPEELVPIGHSIFGKIYDQFKGKVKEAVAFLAKNKEGDLLGVFNRKGFGVVDLVWGDNNGGWSHILNKHVGGGRSFATPEAAAKAIDEIITAGEKVFENGDKAVFRIGDKLVTVRKNLRERGKKIADKNWVLTAYDESAADNGGSAITNVNQAKAAPSTARSDGKGSDSTAEMQGGVEKREDTRDKISQAEAQVETNPTEAQKEAGNYRKGHVTVDGHNITIEQPKGSVRRGKDSNGKEWETTMNNTYGYIRGTKGVDGDHIDVFLSDDPERGDVFVVDQYNPDGSFDEHKVMYGFGNDAEALSAYLSNYEKGWEHGRRIDITGVSKDDFRKWIDSSTRKTKPFASYSANKEKGAFGNIYTQFKNKAKEAIAFLLKNRSGEAVGALNHHTVGEISLVWGNKKAGLEKIATKHPEVLNNLQEIIDRMEVVEESANRVKLESLTHFAVVSKEWLGQPRDKWLLTAYEKKETPKPTDKTMDTGDNPKDLRGDTALSQNSDVSTNKGSEIMPVKQAKDVKTPRKIDDFGEKIEGARKDALSRIAKTLDNVTAKALVELPLGKAVSRPDFGKSVARGEMDERDAMAAEALWQTVYGERKPGNSRKNRFKITRWGEQTARKIENLREFLDADSDKRAKMIEQMKQPSFPNETAEREDYERIVGYNPDKTFLEPVFTPAPEAVALAVMERIGMRPGDKRKIEFQIQTDLAHQYYELRSASGDRVHGFSRVRSLDEAIDNMATAVRIANKDLDVVYPASCFRVVGVDPVMASTGKFSVSWIIGRSGYDERQFDNIQEAEAFMNSKKEAGIPASMRELKTRTGEYGSYKIAFTNPVTDESMEVRNGLGDRNEALMAISESVEDLSEIVNGNYAKKLDNKEVSKPSHFFVTTIYNRSGKHFVVARNGYGTIKLGDFKNPAVKEFDTLKEAEAWFSENSGALEQAYAANLKKRREFVFFKPSKESRRGVDRRGNRDVTPDEFGDMFGFRGVQFGNWTKDADRQMALNEAYDAFLDMADVLGMSPQAMSLNGELGIAFGARGVGGANAHYEPVEVVINLTKTRGAGSLAHEWWHAFDNYMMRRGGNPLLYATEAMTMHGARKEVAEAFRELSKAINESRYHARSMLRGTDYWGSKREESARLFGEWVVSKLAEKNGVNHFLSRGVEPSTMEGYKQLSYWSYKESETLAGRDPKPYKEWIETTESDPLGDYPYPTPEELAELGKPLQKLFDVLEERGNTGEVMEPEAAYQMSLFDRTEKSVGAMQRSLFDDVEQQASRLPEDEGKRLQEAAEIMNEEIDRYNDAYNLYLEQSSPVERLLESYDGDANGRRELQAELDSYGDRFNERQAETARALTSYFRQLGNTPKDAERMSRDKLAQFRADVEMRRRMLNLRGDIHESQYVDLQQPHDMSDDSQVERQEMKTAGDELIQFNSFGRLPRVEQGEFCTVERQFTTTGEFSFTGNDRIDSVDDAAYVFRSLESYAVENTFAMLVKDGRPMIMHLGMGHATSSVVDLTAIRAAMDAYGADDIYFVHNHPSGNLRCSVPDTKILKALNGIVDGKAKVHAIIMDTTSGKYGTFDVDASQEEHLRPASGGDVAVATYRFDRLDPKKGAPDLGQVRTPDDVTRILTDLRLGSGDKVGVLVLDQSNRVVGNFLTPYADLSRSRELADEATGYAAKYGGTGVILYGNSIDFSAIKDVNAAVTSRSGSHVRILDVVSIDNGLNRSAQNSGMMQEPRAKYGAYVNDGGMKRSAIAEAEWRKRMVDERGIVMPGLADKSVNVVEVPRHDFTGTGSQAIAKAKAWAIQNLEGTHVAHKGQASEFVYKIDEEVIGKYLSRSSTKGSDNLGVHLAVLLKLPEVIDSSIEVEIHPDYKKTDKRGAENGIGREDLLIHRLYGAVKIDGDIYRVKTTLKEFNRHVNQAYNYQVTKLELLISGSEASDALSSSKLEPTTHLEDKTSVGVAKLTDGFEKSNDNSAKNELSPTGNEKTAEKRVFSRNGDSSKIGAQESTQAQQMQSLEATKLLNGVEKSYDKGVKILDASKKEEERFRNLYDMNDMELPEVHDDSQGVYGMEEAVTNSMLRLAEKQAESWKARSDAYRAIGGNLSSILQGMSVQKEYDKQTVKRVTDLAQSMLQNGQMTGLRDGEVKRLLSAVKNANGRKDVRKQVEGIVDIMLNSQLRNQEATLDRLLSTRGKKLSPKGIEVAGRLDPGAIAQIATFREMRMVTEADFNTRMSEVISNLGANDAYKAERAALEYAALLAAKEYRSDIIARRTEVAALGESMRLSYDEMKRGEISRQSYNEFVDSCRRTQRGLRAKMVDAYNPLISKLSGIIDEGRARAGEMVDAEKERVRKIYHMIESDMNWVSSDIHKRELTKTQKVTNSAVAQSLTSTLPTFNEILKTFCPMAPGGEGRIYRYFMDKWVLSTENDYTGRRKAFDALAEKSAEILNLSGDKWETIGLKARDLKFTNGDKEMSIRFNDSSGEREFGLRVPEVAYIYAVNKMEDGRMKLNKMGLSDETIKEMTAKLPKEMRDLVDWLQDEFLPSLREKYNAVHLRLFGTEMEKVDNYFPLKIHKGSVHRDVDVANPGADNMQSSVTTGAIIKRTRNARPLDLLHCDIFNVVTEHVRDMEHWAAYSELSKDLNTLLSINEFRAKVENMTTIFGSGPKLWEKFSRCCQIATGSYLPNGWTPALDKAAVNIARGATTAKVAFMPWTAVKQTLSYPAIFMSASLPEIVYSMRHPAEAFNWCLDNLPLFHKRWIGRMAGNEKLLPTELDASFWHRSIVEKLSGIGMTPNAFVDALTISQIAYSTYRTKHKRYLDWGYTTEQAQKKARIDATIAYNETQQSGEAAFLSETQLSRTWLGMLVTAFRNSSIGYQRKLLSGTRDFYNAVAIKGELRQRYIRDKMIEDGLSEEKAEKAARHISSRAMLDAIMKAAATGLLSLLWNIGSHSPYSLAGSDSEEKKEMLKNDVARSVFDFLFQGLAGGDVISAGLTALVTRGDISEYDIEKDMPAISDLDKVMKQFDYDTVGAWNSLFNLAVQTTVGFNPQVISNWVGAVWDACGHDAQTSQEFTILMLRILQAPQSQIDKIYFDELNLSGEQAKKCTPMEIAHRYAEYKVRTGSNILFYGMGFTSDETDRDRIKRYEKRAMKVLKSQINGLYPPEVNVAYDKFKAAHDRIRDQKLGVAKKHDAREITTAQMLSEIDRSVVEDPDYEVFVSFSEMDRRLNKMASGLIDSRSPEEANSYREALRRLKTYMADWYNSDDQTERDSIMDDGLDYADDFLERMKEEWESELDAVNE